MATVTVTVTDRSGGTAADTVSYTVTTPIAKPLMGGCGWNDSEFNTFNAQAGPFPVRRTFDGATLPASASASKAALDVAAGRWSVWSWKPTLTGGTNFLNSVSQQTALKNFLKTFPQTHKLTVIPWHEPEDNIAAGSFTLAQWKSCVNLAGQLIAEVRAEGWTNITSAICLMGYWTFDNRSSYNVYDFRTGLDLSLLHYVAIDPYRYNPGDGSMAALLTINNSGTGSGSDDSCMTNLRAFGKPIILAEWACTETNVTVADKAAWVTATYQWARDSWNVTWPATPIVAAIYFNIDQFVPQEPRATWRLSGAALDAFQAACADSRL